LRQDGHVAGDAFPHQDAGAVRRIAGIGHQHDVAGIHARQDKVVASLLGTDEAQNLLFRIQLHTVAPGIPAGDFPAQREHALFLVGGIAVVQRVAGRPAQFVDNGTGSRFHGIADGQRNDIHTVCFCLVDFFPKLHEQIGGDFF